jgi:hypothetical protein
MFVGDKRFSADFDAVKVIYLNRKYTTERRNQYLKWLKVV